VVALDGGALRFAEVHLGSPDGATDLDVDGWVRPAGPLDVAVKGSVDIAFLELAADIFDRAEAKTLQVDELRLRGTTQSLDIEGAIVLDDALVKTIYFPHAIELEHTRISLRDRVVRIDELEGRLGGGRLEHAAGSTIRLDRTGYRPRQYDLHLECRECTVRYPSFMPPARGDASMWFRGTAPDQLVFGGEVRIEEMVLRDTMNWQRSVLTFREKATENLAEVESDPLFGFDVNIESDPSSVRIANNLGDLRGTARGLHIGGDTNRVLITGQVELSGGTFRYKGHEFQLEPGSAEFREGTEWFPWLEVTMFTDLATRDEDYRVTLVASGRLDNPSLTSTAQPFLTEADINSLLLFGLTQEELERAELADLGRAALAAAAGTYTESAAASLGQSVGGGRRTALPDRVEIVPVYTDTTGSTTFWAVLTKEVVPDLLTLEAGIGIGGANPASGLAKLKLQVARNFYLEGSWITDETSSQAYGNLGLDFKLELDAD
ncbi:MAG: translocation/assembly module TamB domain-containing protein, partial [Deltaproteobacteria bacterium]|nr:translocation/assembly module TamB domain-containing protein [Deltaproteobacteria bacterium]